VSQIHIARSDAVLSMRFGPGEVIVREGEPGSRFYVIAEGEVEVLHDSPDGDQHVIGKLGPGEQFGEVALLREVKRTATVRALTDVQVISMDRRDFSTLVEHLPYLRDSVERFASQHMDSDVARRAKQKASRKPRVPVAPPDPSER
jgi:ATP-binding cassette subfamily B protein